MSWSPGEHTQHIPSDVEWEWQNVKGDLDQDQSLVWFTKFLANNPAFALEFLIGSKMGHLNPIQDIIIRSWILRDFNLLVAGRGFSKSYTASLFLVFYSLFNPGSKIVLCSASFRQSKMIFETIEKFVENPQGGFLRQCCEKNYISRGTDRWEMKIGKSVIIATPLTEKLRGLRAHLVVIDEYLSIPEAIVNEVIRPFMSVKRGQGKEQKRIQTAEDILVERGELKIFIDTREQTPLSFANSEVKKLIVGDYCPNDSFFCNLFVERKSIFDLAGTLTKGLERFEREPNLSCCCR